MTSLKRNTIIYIVLFIFLLCSSWGIISFVSNRDHNKRSQQDINLLLTVIMERMKHNNETVKDEVKKLNELYYESYEGQKLKKYLDECFINKSAHKVDEAPK